MCNFATSIAAAVAVAITAIGASDTAHALAVRLHGIDPIFSIDPGAPGPFIPLQSLDIADNGGLDLDPGQGTIGFSGDFVGYSFDLLAISSLNASAPFARPTVFQVGIVDGVDETGSFVPAIEVSETDFVLSPPGVPIGQEFIVPAANHMVGVTDAAGVVWITTVNTDNLPFGAAVGASSGESAINPGGTFVQSHGAESGFNIVDGSAITLVAGSPFAISTAAIFYPSSFEEPSRTQYTMRTSVVPLPGTAALLLGGLGLLGFHGRRRQGGPSSAILTACSRSQSVSNSCVMS